MPSLSKIKPAEFIEQQAIPHSVFLRLSEAIYGLTPTQQLQTVSPPNLANPDAPTTTGSASGGTSH